MKYGKLIDAIKMKGFTITSMAKEIGMSQGGLSQALEKGTLRVDTFEEIIKALNIDSSVFFENTVNKTEVLSYLRSKGITVIINSEAYWRNFLFLEKDYIAHDLIDFYSNKTVEKTRVEHWEKFNKGIHRDLGIPFFTHEQRLTLIIDYFLKYEKDKYIELLQSASELFSFIIVSDDVFKILIETHIISLEEQLYQTKQAFQSVFKLIPDNYDLVMKSAQIRISETFINK